MLSRRPGAVIVSAAFAASVAALLPGCLYAGSRTVREHGPQVSAEIVGAMKPGEATLEWILATFGEPQARTALGDGREVLRYDSEVRTTEGSYFLMLVASSSNRIERTSWWFEFRGDRLARAWGEKAGPIDIHAWTPPEAVAGAANAELLPPADAAPMIE